MAIILRPSRRALILGGLGASALAAGGWVGLRGFEWKTSPWAAGSPVGELEGVPVFDNGPLFAVSHGRHYAEDGYYFGQKWQCVEFIKRYLYLARGHRMPEVMGHAFSFFDEHVPHGALNRARNLIQYRQGGAEAPLPGDLMVFDGAGGYGHVAIVSKVEAGSLTVVQQNKPPVVEPLSLAEGSDGYSVGGGLPVRGWLRPPVAG